MLAWELANLQLHSKKRGFEGSNYTHAGTSKSIRTPKKTLKHLHYTTEQQ